MRYSFVILFCCYSFISSAQASAAKHFFTANTRADIAGIEKAGYYQSSQMNKYDVKYLKLDITAQPQTKFVTGSCRYRMVAKQAIDTFAIEFKDNMNLDSVYINNIKRTFSRNSDHVYIAFTPNIAAGTQIDAVFYFNGIPAKGIFSGADAGSGLIYTANVSESFQAREWYPSKQLLTDKIDSTDIWITTDANFLAGSNGLLKAVIDLPPNKKQYQWSTRYPIAYYLPCFAVGNYTDYRNYAKPASIAPDSVLIQHYVSGAGNFLNSVKNQLDRTPRFLEKMSELFGTYPFIKEKYGHLQAGIGGGMEHQTMSTMQNFDPYLVAHELAHQWFGDNVTCATWNDIWLNEGFASYLSILMIDYFPSFFTTNLTRQLFEVEENILSQPGGSVYLPNQSAYDENRIFDQRLSYNKGSFVLHNLRFEMQNDSIFFNTCKAYQQRFKDSTATTADFKLLAEQMSGRNYTEFFNAWVYGEGYPTYSVIYSKQGSDTLVINVTQTTSVPAITPLFKGLMEYRVKSAQGDTIIKLNQTQNNQTFKMVYSKAPTGVDVDPNNWVVNKVGTVVTSVSNINPLRAGVSVFPNPAKDNVQIKTPAGIFNNMRILDMQGRLMMLLPIAAGTTLINQRFNLSPGIYFIHLTGKKGSLAERLLINK